MAASAAAIAAEVPAATAAAAAADLVTAAAVAAAATGSSGRLAGNSASTAEAGSSCRPVLGQREEAARLLGLRWTATLVS